MEDASSVKDFRFGLGRHLTKSRRTSNPARRHHVSSSVGEIILSSPSIGRLWFCHKSAQFGLIPQFMGPLQSRADDVDNDQTINMALLARKYGGDKQIAPRRRMY